MAPPQRLVNFYWHASGAAVVFNPSGHAIAAQNVGHEFPLTIIYYQLLFEVMCPMLLTKLLKNLNRGRRQNGAGVSGGKQDGAVSLVGLPPGV
jgi:hypothetical protein